MPFTIRKRDGRVVPFDLNKVQAAIGKCLTINDSSATVLERDTVAEMAVRLVEARYDEPTVEQMQNAVEAALIAVGKRECAKAYMTYRDQRAQVRRETMITPEVRALYEQSALALGNDPLRSFQFFDKYARHRTDLIGTSEEVGRRETWPESCDRSIEHLRWMVVRHCGYDVFTAGEWLELRDAMIACDALPSMRLISQAGAAARRDDVAIMNCSYQTITDLRCFSESLCISMAGSGDAYSVEAQFVRQLPPIRYQRGLAPDRYLIEDSSQGWGMSLLFGLERWFDGGDVQFDYSALRPAGALLRTKGGRSSGPGPLRKVLNMVHELVLARQGSQLRPIDVNDILCITGEAGNSGGQRRCLPTGTRVHTHRGSLPIEEVQVGDRVMTERGYKLVTDWVEQGEQPIVELVLESGVYFRCTPTHRMAVLNDVYGSYVFKTAEDISAEDRILFIVQTSDGEKQSLLPLPLKREADKSGSVVKQPELDEETAWFLGKFFADGHVGVSKHNSRGKKGNTDFSVAFHSNEIEQIERVCKWMKCHGLNPVRRDSAQHAVCVTSHNRQIARWMLNYKQAKTTLKIPEAIWRSDPSIRAAFLAGLMDGDGTYGDRPTVIVTTVYESFGREVVSLLATLGIMAEFRQRRPANDDGWQALWFVSVKDTDALKRASDLMGPFACGKFVPRKGKQSGYSIPTSMVLRDLRRSQYGKKWIKCVRGMNSSTASDITGVKWFVPVKVKEKRVVNPARTYDISVDDGSCFVAQGFLVHNTAKLSLSDWLDRDMQHAKDGDWFPVTPWRSNANNSAVWPQELTQLELIGQMNQMFIGRSGERGIFSRENALRTMPPRRAEYLRTKGAHVCLGTNPCGEIYLQSRSFCNLSQAVARRGDDVDSIARKVRLATIFGTIQSLASNFPLLRPEWEQNAREERLLGVDITGQMDCELFLGADAPYHLDRFRHIAREVNATVAARLGIIESMAITCNKPSGNSSAFLNCAPGINARKLRCGIRNARVSVNSPIFRVLKQCGVPMDPENGQVAETATTWVVHFPMLAPEGSIVESERSALQQLNHWLLNKRHWTEHNPSVTITYSPEEMIDVISWVWEHRLEIGGISFLPRSNSVYRQLPYEETSREEYDRAIAAFPKIDWSLISAFEAEDRTTSSQELACGAGGCEAA